MLEHTADIGVRAHGKTVEELFVNAASGVQFIAFDAEMVQPRDAFPLEAVGEDLEALLVNWINEVIYWFDARRIGFARFDVRVDKGRVAGRGFGEPRDPERHPARLVVKAATYHLLRVSEQAGLWTAEVYLDI